MQALACTAGVRGPGDTRRLAAALLPVTPDDGRLGRAPPLRNEANSAERRGRIGSYSFLLGAGIPSADIAQALILARRWGVAPHEALLSLGDHADAYTRALASVLGLEPLADSGGLCLLQRRPTSAAILGEGLLPKVLIGEVQGRSCLLFDSRAFKPDVLEALLSRPDVVGWHCRLATPAQWRDLVAHGRRRALIGAAVWGHARRSPAQSAAFGVPARQAVRIAAGAGLALGAAAVVPGAAIAASTALLTLPFLAVVSLRSASLPALLAPKRLRLADGTDASLSDAELPTYSVLVALYREGEMLGQLTTAIGRLDYPAAKLDVKLVLEESDAETLAAVARLRLPAHFEIVVVPAADPRTKPKALNYALAFARGEYLVIFDAEDVPQADQLRKAAAMFRAGPPELACLQGRLNIYNSRANWLTRQFTIEYTALFDAILPTLARFGMPMPLGGTSNHFRTSVLRKLGGWDAFNVTEDADLGIRLARRGFACAVLDSTTWEQAPAGFGNWFRQRTRWLKGWMQTYLVHLRDRAALRRELGSLGIIGFHAMLGGMILSALVHPLFYVLLAAEWVNGQPLQMPQSTFGRWMWSLAVANLLLGYLVSIALGAAAVLRRRRLDLVPHALMMPAYWLLISLAAYRGLYHLATAPHRWEKTHHTPRQRERGKARYRRPKARVRRPK